MNDALFLGTILLFIFVLWVYSGGPQHPIAFTGPYLTPITDVGQESQGYGPSANQYLNSGSTISRPGSGNGQIANSARSPYAGKVYIEGGNPRATSARDEFIVLGASDDVTLTGWRLVSAENGSSARIPEGSRGDSTSKRDISLEAGDEAFIETGSRRSGNDVSSSRSVWHAYLGKSSDLWERSDTITLLDANGKVVDQYRY